MMLLYGVKSLLKIPKIKSHISGVNISLLLIQYSENLLRRPCVTGHSHNKCNIVSGSFLQKVHSGVSDKPILYMTLFVVKI